MVIEMPDIKANVIGFGYGAGYGDLICTIIPSVKGIKLGINKGALLKDPEKLLAGLGKVHRFVEIKSEKDLENPALGKLLEEAMLAYSKHRDGNRPV